MLITIIIMNVEVFEITGQLKFYLAMVILFKTDIHNYSYSQI